MSFDDKVYSKLCKLDNVRDSARFMNDLRNDPDIWEYALQYKMTNGRLYGLAFSKKRGLYDKPVSYKDAKEDVFSAIQTTEIYGAPC